MTRGGERNLENSFFSMFGFVYRSRNEIFNGEWSPLDLADGSERSRFCDEAAGLKGVGPRISMWRDMDYILKYRF